MTLYEHVRLHSKHSGSRLLVLLFIASRLDAGEQPTHADLAKDSRMSVRQVTRIVDALELSGELKVDRSGGHTSHRYAIPVTGSDNVDNLSTLQKRQHGRMTAQVRGDGVGETDITNVDNLSTLSDPPTMTSCHVNMSTLPPNVDNMATSNVDMLSGTPLAPSKAETISSGISQPPPSATVDAGATAPRRPKPRPSELDKLSEPERAVIRAWHELTRHYPKLSVWPYILDRLVRDFDPERFTRCGGAYLANFGMGQQHVAGICDWYSRNQTDRNGRDGPPGKVSNVERSMDAVNSFIAKERAANVRRT